jgi:hypothetical protein
VHARQQHGVGTERRDDEGPAGIDRPARHCLGKEYPNRTRNRISAWIEVDRWDGWGSLKDSSRPG